MNRQILFVEYCLIMLLRFALVASSVFSNAIFAVAPVFETNVHISGSPWEFPSKWGPYSDPEAACRAVLWSPSSRGYPDNNYRGYTPTTSGEFNCLCYSNLTGRCALAIPRCPPGFSSGIGAHADITPFGAVQLSNWSVSGCALIGPDPLKPKGQCAGNPIDITTGSKIQTETDITVTSKSDSYSIRRFYLLDKAERPSGSIGPKWWLSIDTRLVHQVVTSYQYVTIYLPSGRGYRYELIGGQWQTSSDEGEKLQLLAPTSSGGNWSFDVSGIRYVFNNAGYLISESSPSTQIVIGRNAANRITSLLFGTTPGSVSYDSMGRISSISVGDQYVDYGFDGASRLTSSTAGMLPRVEGGSSSIRKYFYEDTRFQFALTGIEDETGLRFASWSYDADTRAISSEHAGGKERVTIDYSNINAPGASRVSVTNPLGKITTYHLSLINGMRKVMTVEGHASANCAAANQSYTYYPNGTLQSKTDWEGNITTYVRDTSGRETSRTEASGTPQARTILTEYHPTLNLPTRITEPGKVTVMTYDSSGRLLTHNIQSTTP